MYLENGGLCFLVNVGGCDNPLSFGIFPFHAYREN
jgi:hypothetical protein